MKRTMLPPSLMITSIIGFMVCSVYTISGSFERLFGQIGPSFENFGTSIGFASCLVFIIMFVASMISITPTDEEMLY